MYVYKFTYTFLITKTNLKLNIIPKSFNAVEKRFPTLRNSTFLDKYLIFPISKSTVTNVHN